MQCGDGRIGSQRGGERVLTATGSDQKYEHGSRCYRKVNAALLAVEVATPIGARIAASDPARLR
ncbi:hypothetical protein GCM10023322_01080 [Rugosimonospora acidiphila]|uniref:Uncharacterized protein n=1 Tax=Rugosimonospora acidiphila TaxID=556531 RepID=A0ABP9RGV8_9ACTN